MSTVRGKKSAPSRTDRAAVAVASRMVSPIRPTTAPSASWANLPVSNVSVRSVPLMGAETVMASDMTLLGFSGTPRASSQLSNTPSASSGPGVRQLVTDLDGSPIYVVFPRPPTGVVGRYCCCLLYTSDAADEEDSV